MENASKAIVIAGGILIGIITITVFYFMFNNVGTLVSETSKNGDQEYLLEFNKGFEMYNKKIMYGTDIISVAYKALDNNKKNNVTNDKNNPYYVDIIVSGTFTLSNNSDPEEGVKGLNTNEFKTKTYRCIDVKYNSIGRVCKMQFERYGDSQITD